MLIALRLGTAVLLLLVIACMIVCVSSGPLAKVEAETLLFRENFDGPVNRNIGTMGWAKINNAVVDISTSDSPIGTGPSARMKNVLLAWAEYAKPLSRTYTLKDKEYVEATCVAYMLRNSACGFSIKDAGGKMQRFTLYPSDRQWNFFLPDDSTNYLDWASNVPHIVDLKIRVTKKQAAFSYRDHGTSQWQEVFRTKLGLKNVSSCGICMYAYQDATDLPAIDSIKIRAVSSKYGELLEKTDDIIGLAGFAGVAGLWMWLTARFAMSRGRQT
jgi:hypothetical protein